MKTLSFFILLILSVTLLHAQSDLTKEIDLPRSSLSVSEIIQTIQQQTRFHFSYGNIALLTKKIDFIILRVTVNDLLKKIKQEAGIQYQVKGDKIILIPPTQKRTISGYLRDGRSGENLIAGNVYLLPSQQGTTTNAYGYFSLTMPEDSVNLIASYAGYETYALKFFLDADTLINIDLPTRLLDEVVITDDAEPIHEQTRMSSFDLPIQQLETLPVFVGEVDIMKSLQLLPGVQSGNEGTSGLYVRGGGPDQNLILLDGVPVYNVSHLFGFFSVFNADAINHIELIKGGFPARYGGRLSSVIDISMKEGNDQEIKGEGSIGLIASKLTLEGPLKKEKSSFIISARRTYIDVLTRPFQSSGNSFGYYFYDLNAKLNYILGTRSRLYFSAYLGNDKGFSKSKSSYAASHSPARSSSKNEYALNWGNLTSALRWNYVITPKLFVNTSLTYSKYNLKIFLQRESHDYFSDGTEEHTSQASLYGSGIRDYSLRSDFDYMPAPWQYIKFGAYSTYHLFRPGATNVRSASQSIALDEGKISTHEFGAYAEDDMIVTRKIKVNAGLHFSGLAVENKTFLSVQPRVSARYLLTEDLSLKTSYAHMTQFIHLLTNAGVGLPTDLWVPATSRMKPQKSNQVAVGIACVPNATYEITLESYYKTMDGVLEYKDGSSYLTNENDWESKVEIGKGESYGAEFFLQKKLGKWTGWLGYTLSWTYRQFDNLNSGKRFPYRYDRRHDAEIVLSHAISKKIDFSLTWVFSTGNAMSIPVAEYATITETPGELQDFENALYYESRNGYRMRPYHRMDLSFSFRKTKKWGERAWVVGAYNAYSRQNPFYVDFAIEHKSGKKRLFQYGLFPIIPSITYNFKF